jgi:hypothetical protein
MNTASALSAVAADAPPPAETRRLSIIVEWANTRRHGTPRAWRMLDVLIEQWQAIAARDFPASLPADGARFLRGLDPRAELLIASGDVTDPEFEKEVRRRVPDDCLALAVLVCEGLGYHPLKRFGAEHASGDILLFLDSDVVPDPGWLAHLLASFANPDVHVVFGQAYVAPTSLFTRTFALGWIYDLRDEPGRLAVHHRLFPNNTAFRAEVYRRTGFRPIGRRTRGATTQLQAELSSLGFSVWQNSSARVDHPAPLGFHHLAVRALAHARDYYMKSSEERHLGGLATSLGVGARRLARACYNTFRYHRRVGLKLWQVPAALGILTGFYGIWFAGALFTHIRPAAMGHRFRV